MEDVKNEEVYEDSEISDMGEERRIVSDINFFLLDYKTEGGCRNV